MIRGHIGRRGRGFVLVIDIGRDPVTGKRRQKWYQHRTRQEAETHRVELLSLMYGGNFVPDSKLTVGEFLQRWLRDYASGAVAPTTFARYREIIQLHLTPALGSYPLGRLSPLAIQGYFRDRLERGLSSTTVRHHAMLLHEALRHAVRWGLLTRNPCDMVDPPRRRPAEVRVWDEEQVRLFLAQAKRASPYYRLYLAAVTTGMRQGELLGLCWRDVDLAMGTASVRRTFYRLGKEPVFKEPKTQKARRTVALFGLLVEELRHLREEQAELRRLLGPRYEDNDLVFCQHNGKPLRANNIVRRDFRSVLKQAGLPRIRFHDLRHCHATMLLRQGAHPKVVQERLGHSTPAFTLHVYSHVLPGIQEQAARALESSLFPRRDS